MKKAISKMELELGFNHRDVVCLGDQISEQAMLELQDVTRDVLLFLSPGGVDLTQGSILVPPHNVHIPFPSNWNRSGPSEHSQKVIDIDCQVISLILTNLWPVSEDQELLVPGNTYHDPHIALSP